MRGIGTSERGAAALEFALALPLLFILAFGIIEYGRLAYTRITLHEAVQEGSIYASTHPDDPAGIRLRVVESVDNPAIGPENVTIDCPGDTVRIRVSHSMDLITPVFGPDTVTLTAEVTTDRFTSSPCVPSP